MMSLKDLKEHHYTKWGGTYLDFIGQRLRSTAKNNECGVPRAGDPAKREGSSVTMKKI
jgi:hypothetical protein